MILKRSRGRPTLWGTPHPTGSEHDHKPPADTGDTMPTRRIFELMIVTAILVRPAFGLVHLWAAKTLNNPEVGPLAHGAAEIVTVLI